MNNEFKNLIPGKLYQVLDIELGELDLTISSADVYDVLVAPRGSIVMFLSLTPPSYPDGYYRVTFMYNSFVGYLEFSKDSGWHRELLTYKQLTK